MRLACFLVAAAPLGCNVILGNEPVHLVDPDETLDGSPNNGKLDARSPDTSTGGSGGSGGGGNGGTTGDSSAPNDGRGGTGGSTADSGPGPMPDSSGGGTAGGDGGSNPTPDGSTPVPDGSTPTPDVSQDRTTPPPGTDGSVDSTTPPPPTGDSGPTCTSPNIDCAGKCVSPTDPKTCGSCTHDCTNLPHVSGPTTCQAGACVVPATSCASGYAHCSSNPDEGCEVDISKPANCGSCTTMCTTAAPLCAQNSADGGASGFQCKSQCAAPSPDLCGMSCTSKVTDALNCGACGMACPAPKSHGTAQCAASMCTYQCNPNYSICSGDCVDYANDALNCQTCGHACPSPTANGKAICANSTCAFSCDGGFPDSCNGTCVNFKSDLANCGSCGQGCGANPANGSWSCVNGACNLSCTGGRQQCSGDGVCRDVQTDGANCGSCGHSCLGGTCAGGACQAAPYVSNLTSLNSLTLSSGVLYWSDVSVTTISVASCSASSCSAPTRMANAWATGPIAVSGGRIYAVDSFNGLILTCTTASGCGASSRSTYFTDPGAGDQWNIAAAGTMLAWNRGTDASGQGSICALGTTCSSPATSSLADRIAPGILTATASGGFIGAANPRSGIQQWGGTLEFCASASSCNSPGPTKIIDHQVDYLYMGPATVTPGNIAIYSQSNDLSPNFVNVYACSTGSCVPSAVWTGSSVVTAMASDATSAYWGAGNTLYRCASTNCTSATTAATASSTIVAIALDSTQVFFADSSTIYRLVR